jgi:hypothetical protein
MLYVDPAAGSIVLQIVFAMVAGGALTARRWWGGFKNRLRRMLHRDPPRHG